MRKIILLIQCLYFYILFIATIGQTIKKPVNWAGKYNNGKNNRHLFGEWLLLENVHYNLREVEYEGYDGWYNNFARPDSGAIDRPLLRRWPAAYEDGTYLPSGSKRPNPLTISERLFKHDIGTQSRIGKNALLVFFGQQVVEEILDAQRAACPPEYFNIPIPEDHPFKTGQPHHSVLPVLRTRYDQRTGFSPNNPRQQLNEITPYFDGGLFYGISKQWADQLRTYKNGTIDENGCLASSYDGLFPEFNTDRLPMANPPPPFHHGLYIKQHHTAEVKRFFKLGNPRGNENAFLLSFGVMWFRWHNYIAKLLKKHNHNWKSEQIFNEARKWVIATQQQIVMYEWLPKFVEHVHLPKYTGYDPSIDPQIDQFFQSAAFRFGHTLVTPGVYLRDYKRNNCSIKFNTWNKNAVRTCNIFWRPQDPILTRTRNDSTDPNDVIDVDRLFMGMASQFCEEEDHVIVEDLRGNVFGPLEFPRRDLMAINIQRARDHGLPDFNTAREAFGLERVNFEHFTRINATIRETFKQLYNNSVDDIDVWVGGLLETMDGPGELFSTIIIDQFRRIRDGDRFWFENTKNKLFTQKEIAKIKQITLYDVLMAVTKMDNDDIQRDVFRVPSDNSSSAICKDIQKRNCKSLNGTEIQCYGLPPLNAATLNEPCVQGDSFDYFSNSEASFILSFAAVGTFIVGSIGAMFLLIHLKQKKMLQMSRTRNETIRKSFVGKGMQSPIFIGDEWLSNKLPRRRVAVKIMKSLKQISVIMTNGTENLRVLDFSGPNSKLDVYKITDSPVVIIKCEQNYDLVMHFETQYLVDNVIAELSTFAKEINIQINVVESTLSAAMKTVVNQNTRQKRLEKFFRLAFAQAFKIEQPKRKFLQSTYNEVKEAVNTELTIHEFADSLKMRPQDQFVKRMFYLLDKDKNGFVSFREFLDLLIIFAEGTEQKKAQLLFDMYDVEGRGYLTEEDFKLMIRSFLETVGGKVDDGELQMTISGMKRSANVHHKTRLNFSDFLQIVGKDIKNLSKAKLQFNVLNSEDRGSYLATARDTMENIYESHAEIRERFQGTQNRNELSSVIDDDQEESIKSNKMQRSAGKNSVINYVERNCKEIFWYCLYTLVLVAIFSERAYYYSVEREHSGLRRIAGYGVTITRGAASAMMFTYSSLLVTMCRNTITFLRDSVVGKYFPFDSMVEFHKYIAVWALIFTILHIIGHAFNFYHISTQPADDLTCLFRNYFHATHELPKFHYWCWQTMTGFTGIVLTLIGAVMFIFAQSIVRRKIYNWFWYTHSLYPLFFIFMFLHGMGRLIQPPFFYYFALGPIILFTMDTLVSISRKKIEIPVLKAEILPSNVTMLEFKKPENFQYKSGQWVRIACMQLNALEYHPFTLTSCPDEETLTVHIRSVGPWTNNIRTIYDASLRTDNTYPKIYLDGPYGEGHQDWNLFDISILIGGGIGVTPFASILKDIVYKSSKAKCKKVYFIWVSRTQAQFEWLINIIRDVEEKDTANILSCHIFITQFFEKFDLRTTLLYICERHYQRISGKSLFTNLKAVSHFGRPNFKQFFSTTSSVHSSASTVGIFSCGPPSMTSSVEVACNEVNLSSPLRFTHHFNNF